MLTIAAVERQSYRFNIVTERHVGIFENMRHALVLSLLC